MVTDIPEEVAQITNSYSPECIIALHIQRNNPHLVYNLNSGRFMDYVKSIGIYCYCTTDELRALIYKLITSNPKFLTKLTTKESFLGQVINHLHILIGKNIEICPDLVFMNGRLNLRTGQLFEKTSSLYCTNYKAFNFSASEELTPGTKNFLFNLANRNPVALHCIRIWLRNTLYLDNSDQYALYLVGNGSTGKSTFSNILVSLFESNALNVSLEDIDNKFTKIKLASCKLCIIPDINYKGMTPSKGSFCKSIVSGDAITGENKYEAPVVFCCKSNFLIHGNDRLHINKSSELKTGLSRRFLYIHTGSAPLVINKNLGKELEMNLSGIINWARTAHPDHLSLLGSISSFNDLLNPDLEDGLDVFIKTKVFQNPTESVELGCSEVPPMNSLYYAYIRSLELNASSKLAPNRFPGAFEEKIKALSINIHRKRTGKGLSFIGISLSRGRLITSRTNPTYDALAKLDPFEFFSNIEESSLSETNKVPVIEKVSTNLDTLLATSGITWEEILDYKTKGKNLNGSSEPDTDMVYKIEYDEYQCKRSNQVYRWNLPKDVRKQQGVALTIWHSEFVNRYRYELFSFGLTPDFEGILFKHCLKIKKIPCWTCFELYPRKEYH